MPVPLLDVNAQNHPLEAEIGRAFARVFQSGHFIMGAEVEGFEREIAELTGAGHALGVSSGTDAILLALMALGIGPGDEVLAPAYTFFATAGCVSRVGATPVFVDACPVCFNLNVQDAREKITPKTRAIMPVHLFGQCAAMDAVLELARTHELIVIEDAAQAIGAAYKGRKAGSIGQMGCYSFFPSKNLGALGDAGLLVTNDDELAERARALRNHGMAPKYYHQMVGGNFRLDALQAAFLRVKLPHYAEYTRRRQANADFYLKRLSGVSGVAQAAAEDCECVCRREGQNKSASGGLVLPRALEHNEHIWNQFTLRVSGAGRRDALRSHLAQRGIGCEIYYPLTLDQQECFANLPAASRRGCDIAHRLAQEALSIPIYPELTEAQKEEVASAIEGFLKA